VILAISGGLATARHEAPRRVASSGDSFWYMRQADIFAGTAPDKASADAAAQMCRDLNRSEQAQGRPATCKNYVYKDIADRYRAIFDSRPGFPLVATPLVKLFGAWRGMVLTTMLLAVAAGLLAYVAVWLALGSRRAGIAATVLFYLLPTGYWVTRMLAEGAMIVGYLGVLIGATLLWRGRRVGLPIVAVAMIWTIVMKPASGVALAAVLVAACAATLLLRIRRRGTSAPAAGPRWQGVLAAGGVGLVGLAAWFVVSKTLNLPSLNETIQDYATHHFKFPPDVAHPLPWLLGKNLAFWPKWVGEQLVSPLPVIAFVIAAIVLILRARHTAPLWIAVGLSGVLIMVVHPVSSEYDRLMIPMWLPVAAAFGYLIAVVLPERWTAVDRADGADPGPATAAHSEQATVPSPRRATADETTPDASAQDKAPADARL
jgi:hypothetical protein